MQKSNLKKIVKKTQKGKYKLYPDDIEYIIELANKHPRWSVDRIFNEALKPKMRKCLIIPLTPMLNNALEKAAQTYQISILAITYHVLKEWLESRKYLKPK